MGEKVIILDFQEWQHSLKELTLENENVSLYPRQNGAAEVFQWLLTVMMFSRNDIFQNNPEASA